MLRSSGKLVQNKHFPPLSRTIEESIRKKFFRTGLHLLLHPSDAARWITDRISGGDPLSRGLPWFSWPSIHFLSQWLKPTYSVIEFGGGGSTVFFSARVKTVVTIESDPLWEDRLAQLHLPNVCILKGHTPDAAPVIHYDLVVVDGLLEDRLACFEWGLRQGKPVLLDDAWRWPSLPGRRFTGPGPGRLGITQTLIHDPLK